MDLGKRCMCIADLQKSWIVRCGETAHILLSTAMSITLRKLEDELHNHRLHQPTWETQIRATGLDYFEAEEGAGFSHQTVQQQIT